MTTPTLTPDPDVEWPSPLHPGCNYFAAKLDDGMFCTKCGWFWSAWPPRFTRLRSTYDDLRSTISRLADSDIYDPWQALVEIFDAAFPEGPHTHE